MFLIPQWSPEEEYNYMTVNELITQGATKQVGFYPILEHLTIVSAYHIFGGLLSPIMISQYFNPLFGALTIIPIFLFIRQISSTKTALLTSVFWAFSEASFYRTAIFSSSEIFAFFFAVLALYFYSRKKYLSTAAMTGLAFYTHLLPGFFLVFAIFIHQFITQKLKVKIISIAVLTGVVLFLLSPLSPHQRISSVLNPLTILSHFNVSNIFLYSIDELISGVTFFAGLAILGILALASVVMHKKQNLVIFSTLIAAFAVFVFSWVVYSPNIFAPPRLTFYFILPLAFYASVLLVKWRASSSYKMHFIADYIVIFIIITSLFAASAGTHTMLMSQNSPAREEYIALDELDSQGYFDINPYYWWSDYSIRIAITARSSFGFGPTTGVNETQLKLVSANLADQNATLDSDTPFKYIYFSERMEAASFFQIYTSNRTQQIRVSLHDVWTNSSIWQLIYHNHGVKVYGRN